MSIIKKNPGKLKKLLQSIPIPGWLFSLVTVVYCEVLLHLWTMNDFSIGRFAAVALFALGFGGLLGQIAGFIGHRTWGKWVTAALAAVVSVFYIVEYFVNDAYQSFMPMRMLLGGAKGVTTDFGDVVVSLVLNDLWRTLVMLLPALLFALHIGCNVLNMLLSFAILVLSAKPSELVEELEKRGFSRRMVYIITSVFQIVPQMTGTMNTITDAQRSRGLETEGSLLTRAKAFLPLISPVV